MIDKELLRDTVAKAIEGTDMFLVDITVTPSNEITIEIDSPSGVDIDSCVAITRAIEAAFDREQEDYELEVGSAGLTSPFKVIGQYEKNLGNELEILTRDGRKLRGVLSKCERGADDCDVVFAIETKVKVQEPGCKRPVEKTESIDLRSGDCKYVRYDLKF